MNARPQPLWRSMLFVPVLNDRFLAGAGRRGADAIQLDLEDSIPADRKAEARARVGAAANVVAETGTDIIVRVNRPWRLAVADIEASVCKDVVALNLPKVPGAGHVCAIAEILDELEAQRGLSPGHTGLVIMIETAEGLANINEIARASKRIVALTVGAEDLALSMGSEPVADALYVPNVLAVTAARAAGILPIGYIGSIAELDEDAFRAAAERGRGLGFDGGFCIHPKQVPILNEAFSPRDDEIAHARGVVAAYAAAEQTGKGAASHNGRMIDQPVVDRARALLQRHAAIKAHAGSR